MASAQDITPPLTLEGLATLFRQDVDDLPGDTVTDVNWKNDDTGLLWSNQEIVRYANQAENEFCFRNPIPDHDIDQSITHIAFTGGTQKGNLDAKVLAIHRAKYMVGELGPELGSQAIRICGGSTISKHMALERLYRDARCGGLMPAKSDDCLSYTGKMALGIDATKADQTYW